MESMDKQMIGIIIESQQRFVDFDNKLQGANYDNKY